MLGISKQYTKEIHQELNYSATWFPNVKLSPGDVGIFTDYQYHPKGNLDNFGVPFKISKGPGRSEFDYSSRDSVSIHVKLSGQAPIVGSSLAQADAGITIRFNRENAVLFRATNCRTSHLSNLFNISDTIKEMYKRGEWDRNLILVTQVIEAEGCTIMISNGGNSQIDLSAKAKLNAGNINLADINARFKIIHESNIASRFVAEPKLTPLFEGWGIKLKFFGSAQLGPRGAKKGKTVGEQVDFGKIDYIDSVT